MKKVLLSSIAIAAGTAMAMAQALPEYPDKLDLTLNGEKELSGVTVTQEMVPYDGNDYLTITVKGEYDANEITLDMVTPEGWDGMLVRSNYTGESEDIEPLRSKAPAKEDEDLWMPTWMAMYYGVTEGNTITFPVDGKEWGGMALLVKGENTYMVEIDFVFEVNKPAGYPDHLDFTLNGDKELKGVSVSQTMKPYNGSECLTINITGEYNADAITMDFVTPKGWDYALIDAPTDGEDSPFTTRSGEADHWVPVKDVISMGYKKGTSFKFPVNGKENLATIYLVKGDNVWEYSIDISFKVSKAEGGDEPGGDVPAYPDHLDYTLNGEKELPGITVRQLIDATTQAIEFKGECDSDNLTLTFATPEGWDGLMIADFWETGEITTVQTRALNDLIPISSIEGMGFKKGNTITYPVDGEANIGYIALIKGDMACQTFIDYSVTVSKSEGGDEPGEDPVIPESYIVNTFNEGLEVTQGYNKWGSYDVIVKGEVFANSVPIVIDVPEGWDGFISYNWSHEGDVTITENDQNPRGTRAEEIEWVSVEKLLENGYEKGNRFTFEPTFVEANNNYHTVEIHLYKGDMATKEEIISLEVRVSKANGPEVPESFEVSVSPTGLNVTQGEDYGIYTIVVEGESSEDEVEVTLAVPEGWDGFIGMTDSEYDSGDAEPMKKVQTSEWEPLENLLAWGFKETNTLKFKADGEQHSGALYLYKAGLVDGANAIAVYTKVIKNDSSVASVESAGSVRYFDLNGIEVDKPISGVYVKNVNGKITKVVVR